MKISDILTESLEDMQAGNSSVFTGERVDNPKNGEIMAQAVVDAREAFKLSRLYQNRNERPYTWAEQREWVLHHIRNDSIHGPEDHEGAWANNFPKRYIAEYGPESRNAGTASMGGATEEDIAEQRNAYQGRSSAAKKGSNQTGQQFQNTPAIDRQIQDMPDQGMASRDAYQRKSDTKTFKTIDKVAGQNKYRHATDMPVLPNETPRDTAQAASRKQTKRGMRNSDQHVERKAAYKQAEADGTVEMDVPASAVPEKKTIEQVRSYGKGGNLKAPRRKNV